MRLLAISDLHVGHPRNLEAVAALPPHPDDWLIVAGDVGETLEHLSLGLGALVRKFARVFWTPGNHELWTTGGEGGAAKYDACVSVARGLGVVTPEDPYVAWPELAGPPLFVAPLFLLYDYSFAPDGVAPGNAVAWAGEAQLRCADEELLDPAPHPTRAAWCAARCDSTEARLAALPDGATTILVNHFPLHRAHAVLPRIPRFAIWCGTRRSESYAERFRARAVVSGHLHLRTTRYEDGVLYEEVSLGYPRDWSAERGVEGYLRTILPRPDPPASRVWR